MLAHELTHVVQQGSAQAKRAPDEPADSEQSDETIDNHLVNQGMVQLHSIDGAPPPPTEEDEDAQVQRLLQRQIIEGKQPVPTQPAGAATDSNKRMWGHRESDLEAGLRRPELPLTNSGGSALWGIARTTVQDRIKALEEKEAINKARKEYQDFIKGGGLTVIRIIRSI